MKGILWSIRRPHTDNITSGKKTIEVRKGIPKDLTPETPNFIYETKANGGCGKVIGEFKVDKIYTFKFDWITFTAFGKREYTIKEKQLKETCLTMQQLFNYAGNEGHDRNLYGLHITDLKIYDTPKELSEFKRTIYLDSCCKTPIFTEQITRPPQNYCYLEV